MNTSVLHSCCSVRSFRKWAALTGPDQSIDFLGESYLFHLCSQRLILNPLSYPAGLVWYNIDMLGNIYTTAVEEVLYIPSLSWEIPEPQLFWMLFGCTRKEMNAIRATVLIIELRNYKSSLRENPSQVFWRSSGSPQQLWEPRPHLHFRRTWTQCHLDARWTIRFIPLFIILQSWKISDHDLKKFYMLNIWVRTRII